MNNFNIPINQTGLSKYDWNHWSTVSQCVWCKYFCKCLNITHWTSR